MDSNTEFNSKTGSPKYEFLRKTTYKIGVGIIILIVIHLILNQMIPLENLMLIKSDGSISTVDDFRKMNIWNIVLKLPIVGFALGSILSFIPFKKIHYKRKWLRFSLLVILVLYLLKFVDELNLLS